MVILGTIDLKKRFKLPGQKPIEVLRGVNFSVAPGEKVAIIGKSGAGKSTLLNILGGLEKQSSGTVTRPENIGFVFQQYHLMPELTVLENVLLPTMAKKIRRCVDSSIHRFELRAEELLEKVGLKDRLDHLPGELSGGEMQRVALCRALVTSPELVLADEPTGNLDAKSAKAICEILKELNKSEKSAILLVTHDPVVAASAKKVAFLKDGAIAAIHETGGDAEVVSRLYLETYR